MSNKAKNSLCWTCKHGMCVKETSKELMLPMIESQGKAEVKEVWQEPEAEPEIMPIDVERDSIKAICFWRPASVPDAPPILVAEVKECNRYEKQNE